MPASTSILPPPGGNPILAIDLGQRTGWALSAASGLITSGTELFRPGRFEGGGMPMLRFAAWLSELHAVAGGRPWRRRVLPIRTPDHYPTARIPESHR